MGRFQSGIIPMLKQLYLDYAASLALDDSSGVARGDKVTRTLRSREFYTPGTCVYGNS